MKTLGAPDAMFRYPLVVPDLRANVLSESPIQIPALEHLPSRFSAFESAPHAWPTDRLFHY
jgi:hypothetical protein